MAIPPGMTMDDPRVLQETILAASENRVPFDYLEQPNGTRSTTPSRPSLSLAETVDDRTLLTVADLIEARRKSAEEFEMPGTGKSVWVHPIGIQEMQLLASWLQAVDIPEEDEARPKASEQVRQAIQQQELQVMQVVLCCYHGPERSSGRCFKRADIPALKSYLGFGICKKICEICDRISEGGGSPVGDTVRRFFVCSRRMLSICASALSTSASCPAGFADLLEEFDSLVLRALSPAGPDSGMKSEVESIIARVEACRQ